MRKDHNKYVFAKRRKADPKNWRLPGLAIVVVFFLSVILFVGYKYNPGLDLQARNKFATLLAVFQHKGQPKNKVDVKSPIPVGNSDEVHFEFYSELPKMQVTVPTVAEAKAPPPPIRKEPQYIVEIGVFNNAAAAGEFRVSLLLAGIQAEIIKQRDGDQEIYRLQQGPFETAIAAKNALQKLQKKAIDAEVKKIDQP